MDIQLELPPISAALAAADGIEQLRFRDPPLITTDADPLFLAVPHPVYQLALKSLFNQHWLDEAFHTSWRFILMANDQPTAAVEVIATDSRRNPFLFSRINIGRFINSTVVALGIAEEIKSDSKLYLRLLQIPAIQFIALWFHGDKDPDDTSDLIIPLDPAPGPIEPYVPYLPDKLRSTLISLAKDRIEMGNAEEGPVSGDEPAG